jgi:cytochrome P450
MAKVLASWVDMTSYVLDPGSELSGSAAGQDVLRANLACIRAVRAFLDSGDKHGQENSLAQCWRRAETAGSREEVILSVLQLFQAGYETIVSAICYIVGTLVINQPTSRSYTASAGELACFIDEGIRLASPVRATFRRAVGTQVINGVPVPDGAMVMALIGSANRDERVFSGPAQIRLDRQAAHIAFGAGPHRCMGRALAHMELKHILNILIPATTCISAMGEAQVSANILKASYEYLPVSAEWC